MTTKEVQNPGEDAEPEEESGNLGGGIAGLAFVHGPDDEVREVLRRLGPRLFTLQKSSFKIHNSSFQYKIHRF